MQDNSRCCGRACQVFSGQKRAVLYVASDEPTGHETARITTRDAISRLGSLPLEERQWLVVWAESVDFPLVLTWQVFKDGAREQGCLWLVSSELTGPSARADSGCLLRQYARRWNGEECPK